MRRRVEDMMSLRTKSGESHWKILTNTRIDRSNVEEKTQHRDQSKCVAKLYPEPSERLYQS
jgi:hypothetical protein